MTCGFGTVYALLYGMSTALDTTQFLSTLDQAQSSHQSASLKAANQGSVDKVSQQFASLVITQFLNIAYEGLPVDPNFGGGHGEETWRSMLLDEYGKKIGSAGGLGLADMVKRQLLKTQEVQG